MTTHFQHRLFDEPDLSLINRFESNSTTFVANMKLPLHRWFRYSAGFSAEWVKRELRTLQNTSKSVLFDPFAGSGTTIIAGQEVGIDSIGLEAHPFVARIAQAKLKWSSDMQAFRELSDEILKMANSIDGKTTGYAKLIYDCYPEDVLLKLDALKSAYVLLSGENDQSILCWLALTSILRICSPVGTAQMELIQPRKRKQKILAPFTAFRLQVELMLADMADLQLSELKACAVIQNGDARTCEGVDSSSVNIVISSPPYVNNYDYADSTRLEMSFWGEVAGWGDLHAKVRRFLVRSCSQHMSSSSETLDDLLENQELYPIKKEIAMVCNSLSQERLLHGGKKNYHLMVAAYFFDLAQVWQSLRRVCASNSIVCFVVGDSAPYGIHVPVQEWLGRLAVASGFHSFHFEKTRDRNIKWKNRKHRVPLCEGYLWVKG